MVAFRGDYWQLRPEARHLCRNLLYPVPDPAFPFLGVHATRRIGTGEGWLADLSTERLRELVALSADAVAEA